MFARALSALVLSLSLAALPSCHREKASGALTIAVIPKGTTHEFWKAVHAGAMKGAKEFGVSLIWKGPLKEDDLKGQIDVVQSFTAQGVSAIALAPLNEKALGNAVKGAVAAKIPVLVFDSDLQGQDHVSFVATDNVAAGKLAGQEMAKILNGKGRVAVLRYMEGSASTSNREKGFIEAIHAAPGIALVSDNQYGGSTTESAFATSENLLSAQKASEGGLDGVFCPNESTTFAMMLALKKAGLAGKVHLVGFDASEKMVQGLRDGQIDALVLQNPFNMGYLAVKTIVAHVRGEQVPARIDTGAQIVTKANMDVPEVKAVLSPDLKSWLNE